MKNRILINDLKNHIDQEVVIGAWVDTRRDQGKMIFFEFRDRAGKVQGVTLPNSAAMETAKTLRSEWVVAVTGKVNKRPERNVQADKQNGGIELEVLGVEIMSEAQDLPFGMDAELNLDTLLDYRPFTIRREREKAIFKTQHILVSAFREYLSSQNFTEFQAPKLVGGDAEGGAGVFKVDYFYDRTAYLATSPQLYKQMMVGAFERVFTTGVQFRAEKHATSRHLNEISMLDFEMGFITDHTDVMKMIQGVMQHCVKKMSEDGQDQLKFFGIDLPLAPENFPVMKLREAQQLIKEKTGVDKTNEPDLEPEDERWLCEYAKNELGSDFIFVTHYPVSKRPFYTMEDFEDAGMTKSFDLLFRGVEIVSGGQRVHNYDMLVEKIKSKGLDPEKFSFYLMAFKYGIPPHGGIGLGLERLTQKFLGVDNVKEATLFPRDINRIDTLMSKQVDEMQ
jgi:nondiscriminating aspartyl-tRNA synthetase